MYYCWYFLLGVHVILGMGLIAFGGMIVGLIYMQNLEKKLKLTIWMNNGEGYSLTSSEIDFLYKVAYDIEYCMNESDGYCQIDFKVNDITNCNFSIGEYNSLS